MQLFPATKVIKHYNVSTVCHTTIFQILQPLVASKSNCSAATNLVAYYLHCMEVLVLWITYIKRAYSSSIVVTF